MSLNFYYMDIPRLSKEIETDALSQISDDNILTFRPDTNIGKLFKMYFIKPGITRDFLIEHFGTNLKFRIQTQTQGWQPPHIDGSRTYAINYYFNLGGQNCITNFYKELSDKIPIESHRIEERSWCRLNVSTPHHVVGITDIRVALTVCDG